MRTFNILLFLKAVCFGNYNSTVIHYEVAIPLGDKLNNYFIKKKKKDRQRVAVDLLFLNNGLLEECTHGK